jgi:hypothetical protein
VAPIALFPDNLVAQVLAGSTYPDQITAADNLLGHDPGLKGDALQAQVSPQPWDASVKALTTFPSVLDQMASNVQWTTALGEAYVNDPTDVMNAIQVMRQRAAKKGNLSTNAQQFVQTQPASAPVNTEYDGQDQGGAYYDGPSMVQAPAQTIEILPARQDTVYVPSYDPQTVYGGDVPFYPSYNYQRRGYSTGEIVTAGAITFGAGILIGGLLDNHHRDHNNNPPAPGGGWHSWGMNWGGGEGVARQRPSVIHNDATYVSHSTVINRYTSNNINNNINNSRTTINNVDSRRNPVVQNRNVDNRMLNHPSRPAASSLPQRSAMSVPHVVNTPQQARRETVRTPPARPLARASIRPEQSSPAAPHASTPRASPAHAAVIEPNRNVRSATLQPQPHQREAAQPTTRHAIPTRRPVAVPHVGAHPAVAPRTAPRPAVHRAGTAPRPAPAPRAQHAAAHPGHPALPVQKDKHNKHNKADKNDNNGHS